MHPLNPPPGFASAIPVLVCLTRGYLLKDSETTLQNGNNKFKLKLFAQLQFNSLSWN